MPGVTVDGNNVLEVYEKTAAAVKRAREGKGPTLIDSITCRWEGHYVGDPMVYRPEGELEEWKAKDPIANFEETLISQGVLKEAEKKKILKRIDDAIAEAEEFAENSPYPEPQEALEHVYC
jgi:pyruvate dehydrogenase E1 component alpha subunit